MCTICAYSVGALAVTIKTIGFARGRMHSLVKAAAIAGFVLFGGFFCVVTWKLLTGEISLSYLLDGDVRDSSSSTGFTTDASAGRTQTLLVTISVAGYYLLQVIHNPKQLPSISPWMVGVLGGSQALYLGEKVQAMLPGRMGDFFK